MSPVFRRTREFPTLKPVFPPQEEMFAPADAELKQQYPHLLNPSPNRRRVPRNSPLLVFRNGTNTSPTSPSNGSAGHTLLLYFVASIATSYCLLRITQLWNRMRNSYLTSQSQSRIWQDAASQPENTADSSWTHPTESQP
jgi:hypothetical protein